MTTNLIARLRASARVLERVISDQSDPDVALVAPGFAEMASTATSAATLLETQSKQLEVAREALEAVCYEAERENGGWVHLKRVIGTHARTALKEMEVDGG